MQKAKEWFSEWFDSHYYHILYKHRDHQEAESFIDNLKIYLHLKYHDQILDLACGKGRHAIYMNRLGFNVTGLDLAPKSISHARQFENDRLRFYVHDMRKIWKHNYFDYVFNLFTSFGYFNTDAEHQQAIKAMAENLKTGGKLLLDFLNTYKTIHNLVPKETKTIDGVTFHIFRNVTDGFIIKKIRFEDEGKSYEFEERVKAISRMEFLSYFKNSGLHTEQIFGDYNLNLYVEKQSDRMIFLVKK